MGLWQPGDVIAPNAGGQLQAITAARSELAGRVLLVEPLDAPLVAPADSDFMRYDPGPPNFSAGLRFNLHNNKWGTNFPMWCEGEIVARYILTIADAKG